MKNYEIIPDIFLTKIIGKPCYELKIFNYESITSIKIPKTNCFIWAKTTSSHSLLSSYGFYFIDHELTFEAYVNQGLDILEQGEFHESYTNISHLPKISKIAENSFHEDRFHKDPQIPTNVANKIKQTWAENYYNKTRGDRLIVSKHEGEIGGFASTILHNKHVIIDLIAVEKRWQGMGMGSRLLHHVAASCRSRKYIVAGTMASNIPAVVMYLKNGFWVSKMKRIYHYHG